MKKRTVKHVLFGTVQYGLMLFYAVFLVLPVFRPSRCPPLSPDRYPWNPSGVCLLIMSS